VSGGVDGSGPLGGVTELPTVLDISPIAPILESTTLPLPTLLVPPPLANNVSTPGPSVSTPLSSSPLLSSYRDILLAHLPVYTDKASLKSGTSSMGASLRQNVTIRHGKAKKVVEDVTENPPEPDPHLHESIPLSSHLSFSSSPGALRAQPESTVT